MRNGFCILHPVFFGQAGFLQHGGIIAHHRQRGLQLVGHIGDEVGTQGFRAGQFLCHGIDGGADLIEALHAGTVHWGDADREIPLHDLFRGIGDDPHRPIDHDLAANMIDGSKQEGQQQHIQKGHLGSCANIFFAENKSHAVSERIDKEQHAARYRKSHRQKKHHIIVDGLQHLPGRRFFHLITAL